MIFRQSGRVVSNCRINAASTKALIVLVCVCGWPTAAQAKPQLTVEEAFRWPSVANPAISGDGRYVGYSIKRVLTKETDETVVQATDGAWKIVLPRIDRVQFTPDSRFALFKDNMGRLNIQRCGASERQVIDGVGKFASIALGARCWLVYALASTGHSLTVRELGTDQVFRAEDAEDFWLDANSIIYRTAAKLGDKESSLFRLFPDSGSVRELWKGVGKIQDPLCGPNGTVVFLVRGEENSECVWRVNEKGKQPIAIGDTQAETIGATPLRLSLDGNRLFLAITDGIRRRPDPTLPSLDVWTYKDSILQSRQLLSSARAASLWVIDFARSDVKPHRLQEPSDGPVVGESDDYVVIDSSEGDWEERNWNPDVSDRYIVVSTATGERRMVQTGRFRSLDRTGRFAIFRETASGNLLSYATDSGKIRNLTQAIVERSSLARKTSASEEDSNRFVFACWSKDMACLFAYDDNDIWRLSPDGTKEPFCVTNKLGRTENLRFRFLKVDDAIGSETSVVDALDNKNLDAGYYRISTDLPTKPVRLSMGPNAMASERAFTLPILRAKDRPLWLVPLESCNSAPNLFLTGDFEKFEPLSSLHPEENYNWVRSELIQINTPRGYWVKGVLFKPEDLDVTKRYPTIVNYYENKSKEKNCYQPAYGPDDGGNINIPWFVNHGYLVVTVDLHDTVGNPGADALDSVVGAAKYLDQLGFCDPARIGLQGHSWGGYYTNYIVSHTDMFRAAWTSCGASDLVSQYGDTWGSGTSYQGYFELRNGRMRGTLWEKKNQYVDASPIFNAEKIKTPLLLTTSKRDGNVHMAQVIQLFTALRRLGGRAWMLQYDDGGHGMSPDKREGRDQLLRTTQFFDYYLKDALPPKWMTEGVPARLKGVETGLEFDTSGKAP